MEPSKFDTFIMDGMNPRSVRSWFEIMRNTMMCSAVTWAGFQLLAARPDTPKWVFCVLIGLPSVFVGFAFLQAYKLLISLVPQIPASNNPVCRWLGYALIAIVASIISISLLLVIFTLWFFGAFKAIQPAS